MMHHTHTVVHGVTECGATQQCNVWMMCRTTPQYVVPHHIAQWHYWFTVGAPHPTLGYTTVQCVWYNKHCVFSIWCHTTCGATPLSAVWSYHRAAREAPHRLIFQLSPSCLAWSWDDFLIPRIFPRSIISDNNNISPVILINSSFLSDNYWLLCISLSEPSSLFHLDIITCAKLSFKPFSNLLLVTRMIRILGIEFTSSNPRRSKISP